MKKKRSVLLLLAFIVVVLVFLTFTFLLKSTGPLKIGVLLDLTGLTEVDSDEVLNWAAGHINDEDGINGKKIELVYKDTYNA